MELKINRIGVVAIICALAMLFIGTGAVATAQSLENSTGEAGIYFNGIPAMGERDLSTPGFDTGSGIPALPAEDPALAEAIANQQKTQNAAGLTATALQENTSTVEASSSSTSETSVVNIVADLIDNTLHGNYSTENEGRIKIAFTSKEDEINQLVMEDLAANDEEILE